MNVFVNKSSSGLIRFAAGVFSAIGAYNMLLYCQHTQGSMCIGELINGSFFALFLLALGLIPLGAIQLMWFLAKNLPIKTKFDKL